MFEYELIKFGIGAVILLLVQFFGGGDTPETPTLEDLNVNRSPEGSPIPIVLGRHIVDGLSIIDYGETGITKDRQLVAVYGICLGGDVRLESVWYNTPTLIYREGGNASDDYRRTNRLPREDLSKVFVRKIGQADQDDTNRTDALPFDPNDPATVIPSSDIFNPIKDRIGNISANQAGEDSSVAELVCWYLPGDRDEEISDVHPDLVIKRSPGQVQQGDRSRRVDTWGSLRQRPDSPNGPVYRYLAKMYVYYTASGTGPPEPPNLKVEVSHYPDPLQLVGIPYFREDGTLGTHGEEINRFIGDDNITDVPDPVSDPTEVDFELNPASAIAYLLTNSYGGQGIGIFDEDSENNPKLDTITYIDRKSFVEAARALYEERHGVSLVLASSAKASGAINEILYQINGVLLQNEHGNIELRLTRDEDTAVNPIAIDSSQIKEIKRIRRSSWADAITKINMTYNRRRTGVRIGVGQEASIAIRTTYTNRNVVVQDHTAQDRFGYNVRSQSFSSCKTENIATRIAEGTLKVLGRPLYVFQIEMLDVGRKWAIGDVIKITFPDIFARDQDFRILAVHYDDITKGCVRLDCADQNFLRDANTYDPSPEDPWLGPDDADYPGVTPDHVFIWETPPFWFRFIWHNIAGDDSSDIDRNGRIYRDYYLAARNIHDTPTAIVPFARAPKDFHTSQVALDVSIDYPPYIDSRADGNVERSVNPSVDREGINYFPSAILTEDLPAEKFINFGSSHIKSLPEVEDIGSNTSSLRPTVIQPMNSAESRYTVYPEDSEVIVFDNNKAFIRRYPNSQRAREAWLAGPPVIGDPQPRYHNVILRDLQGISPNLFFGDDLETDHYMNGKDFKLGLIPPPADSETGLSVGEPEIFGYMTRQEIEEVPDRIADLPMEERSLGDTRSVYFSIDYIVRGLNGTIVRNAAAGSVIYFLDKLSVIENAVELINDAKRTAFYTHNLARPATSESPRQIPEFRTIRIRSQGSDPNLSSSTTIKSLPLLAPQLFSPSDRYDPGYDGLKARPESSYFPLELKGPNTALFLRYVDRAVSATRGDLSNSLVYVTPLPPDSPLPYLEDLWGIFFDYQEPWLDYQGNEDPREQGFAYKDKAPSDRHDLVQGLGSQLLTTRTELSANELIFSPTDLLENTETMVASPDNNAGFRRGRIIIELYYGRHGVDYQRRIANKRNAQSNQDTENGSGLSTWGHIGEFGAEFNIFEPTNPREGMAWNQLNCIPFELQYTGDAGIVGRGSFRSAGRFILEPNNLRAYVNDPSLLHFASNQGANSKREFHFRIYGGFRYDVGGGDGDPSVYGTNYKFLNFRLRETRPVT